MKSYTEYSTGNRFFELDKHEVDATVREMREFLRRQGYTSKVDTDELKLYVKCFQDAYNHDPGGWSPMYKTHLYVDQGCEYCALQMFFSYDGKSVRPFREATQKEWERREAAKAEKRRREELLAYLNY